MPPLPTMTPIEGSSQIAAVGRDGDFLYVTFKGYGDKPQATYRYWRKDDGEGDHPTAHHDVLLNVAQVENFSAGKHFNKNVRHQFAYDKVIEPASVDEPAQA